MTPRHPSRRRLQRWLDTGDPPRVSRHVDQCEECQMLLDDGYGTENPMEAINPNPEEQVFDGSTVYETMGEAEAIVAADSVVVAESTTEIQTKSSTSSAGGILDQTGTEQNLYLSR